MAREHVGLDPEKPGNNISSTAMNIKPHGTIDFKPQWPLLEKNMGNCYCNHTTKFAWRTAFAATKSGATARCSLSATIKEQ
jgi:hypothetical protein